jgi:hypothetical protein
MVEELLRWRCKQRQLLVHVCVDEEALLIVTPTHGHGIDAKGPGWMQVIDLLTETRWGADPVISPSASASSRCPSVSAPGASRRCQRLVRCSSCHRTSLK